jgi:hypothetical protein
MKFKMALAAAALALVGASAANAQLRIVLDSPVQLVSAAQPILVEDPINSGSFVTKNMVTFSGTIFNDNDPASGIIYTLDGDGATAPAGLFTDVPNQSLAITQFPLDIGPGGSHTQDWLFAVEPGSGFGVDAGGNLLDPLNGFFYSASGFDNAGNPVSASAQYGIFAGAAQVPEPGTVALLVGGLIGGSLTLVRRRK